LGRRRRRRRFMYKYCENSLISSTKICSESGSQSAYFEAADPAAAATAASYRFHNIAHWIFNQKKRILKKKKKKKKKIHSRFLEVHSSHVGRSNIISILAKN
jgi:hypothetical protein